VCQNAAFFFLLHSLELIDFVGHFFRDGLCTVCFYVPRTQLFFLIYFPIKITKKIRSKITRRSRIIFLSFFQTAVFSASLSFHEGLISLVHLHPQL
jgi:hypothetical protein